MVRVPRMLFFAQILQEAQAFDNYFCLKISDFLDFVLSCFFSVFRNSVYYTRELSHLSIYLMVLWLMPWKLFANAQVQSPFIFLLYPQLRTITFDYVSCWSQWAGTVLQTMAKGYVYKHKIMIQRRGADGATIFTSR